MTDILNDKYEIIKENYIGKGGFGTVFKAYDILNKKNVAIKIDKKKKYNKREYKIYSKLLGKKDMPQIIDYFENEDSSFLVMDLYSKDACTICKLNKKNYFNEKDILMIGIQIIQQIGTLHKIGILHRDIKPDNFIYDSLNNKFKLIDYGLSKPYIISGKHIDENKNNGRCGTMRYMSINAHLKKSLSRKDDMISLSYSLIYLYCKKLPWQGIKEEKTEIHNKIVDLKKNFNTSFKDYNIIEPLLYLYNYSTNLKFDSKPDYSFLIQYFYKSLKNNSYKYNGKWSWYSELN